MVVITQDIPDLSPQVLGGNAVLIKYLTTISLESRGNLGNKRAICAFKATNSCPAGTGSLARLGGGG